MTDLDKYFQDMWDKAESPTAFVNEILCYYREAPEESKEQGAACIPLVARAIRAYNGEIADFTANEEEDEDSVGEAKDIIRSANSPEEILKESLKSDILRISIDIGEIASIIGDNIKSIDTIKDYVENNSFPAYMKSNGIAWPCLKESLLMFAGCIVADNSVGYNTLRKLDAAAANYLLSIAYRLKMDYNVPVQILYPDTYLRTQMMARGERDFYSLGNFLFSLPVVNSAFSRMEANEARLCRLCKGANYSSDTYITQDMSISAIMQYLTKEVFMDYCSRDVIEGMVRYARSKSDSAVECLCFITGCLIKAVSGSKVFPPKLSPSIGGIVYRLVEHLNYTEKEPALLITEVEFKNLNISDEVDITDLGRRFLGIS